MPVAKTLHTPTEQATIASAWLKLHRRHLPLILGIAGFHLLLVLGFHLASPGQALFKFRLDELVILSDLIILPLAAMNSIFWAQQLFKGWVHSGWKMIALKITATVLGVFFTSLLLESFYSSLGYVDDDYLVLGDFQFSAFMTNVIEYTMASLFIGLPIFIWQLRLQDLNFKLQQKEIEQERLVRLKTQAELHALQSRINPHFLFNSFNSIASLISSNPVGAENMMVQLSELFRYSLNSQESHFVTLQEELQIVETYLGIEKVRFGENLDYQIVVPDALYNYLIPRFLIQPLVENAVKHATSKVKQGEIRLVLEVMEESLILRLYDNGPAFPEPIKPGYGLQSTYDKLQLLYPEKHRIEFINQLEKHLCIMLLKPVST